jgi:hypothetical protein
MRSRGAKCELCYLLHDGRRLIGRLDFLFTMRESTWHFRARCHQIHHETADAKLLKSGVHRATCERQ